MSTKNPYETMPKACRDAVKLIEFFSEQGMSSREAVECMAVAIVGVMETGFPPKKSKEGCKMTGALIMEILEASRAFKIKPGKVN
jgi:hypothetical protein